MILKDTVKCLMISAAFAMVLRFSLGRVHYTKYISWGFKGVLFGAFYSSYFTIQKVDTFLIEKKIKKKII